MSLRSGKSFNSERTGDNPLRDQIKSARDSLKVKGNTLKDRIKEIEDNPNLMDIKYDITTIVAMISILREDLDLRENSGKDKLALLKQLSDMLRVSSDLKEKAFKIKSGHFDLEAMKTVVIQIVNSLKYMRSELDMASDARLTKEYVMNLVDRTILNIETVKVPMISNK